jgi:hypothetical protein
MLFEILEYIEFNDDEFRVTSECVPKCPLFNVPNASGIRSRPSASQEKKVTTLTKPKCIPVHLELPRVHHEEVNWLTPQKYLVSKYIYVYI